MEYQRPDQIKQTDENGIPHSPADVPNMAGNPDEGAAAGIQRQDAPPPPQRGPQPEYDPSQLDPTSTGQSGKPYNVDQAQAQENAREGDSAEYATTDPVD